MSGLVHPDQNVRNATQNSLCRAVSNHGRSFDRRDGWVEPLDYERAVVVEADGQRKQTRPLAGVNGEVCKEKRKKLWNERKKT